MRLHYGNITLLEYNLCIEQHHASRTNYGTTSFLLFTCTLGFQLGWGFPTESSRRGGRRSLGRQEEFQVPHLSYSALARLWSNVRLSWDNPGQLIAALKNLAVDQQ